MYVCGRVRSTLETGRSRARVRDLRHLSPDREVHLLSSRGTRAIGRTWGRVTSVSLGRFVPTVTLPEPESVPSQTVPVRSTVEVSSASTTSFTVCCRAPRVLGVDGYRSASLWESSVGRLRRVRGSTCRTTSVVEEGPRPLRVSKGTTP